MSAAGSWGLVAPFPAPLMGWAMASKSSRAASAADAAPGSLSLRPLSSNSSSSRRSTSVPSAETHRSRSRSSTTNSAPFSEAGRVMSQYQPFRVPSEERTSLTAYQRSRQ